MSAPAHQVLRLVSGMLAVDRAQASTFDQAEPADGGPQVIDADRADAIADAIADAEARFGPVTP